VGLLGLLIAGGSGPGTRAQDLAEGFAYADERLAVEPLENLAGGGAAIRFRVENRATGPVADGWAVAAVEVGGEVRRAWALRLPQLAPGEAVELARELPGLELGPGEDLVLRAVRPGDPGVRQELAQLRHLVAAGPPADPAAALEAWRRERGAAAEDLAPFAELRRRVAAQEPEEGTAELPLDLAGVDLRACTTFCLECAQIASIICRRGVRELVCNCEMGFCAITCA
jgi:hypothetical protein